MNMLSHKRLTGVFNAAETIDFDDSSKIVLISDCHRGTGNHKDDFSNNQTVYFAALNYYFNHKYTYIELGDGEELWENTSIADIKQAHSDVYWLLSKFYEQGRLYMIFGNHDIVKKNDRFIKENLSYFYDEREKKEKPLFENIKIPEAYILHYAETGDKILLVHGHQGDVLNDYCWRLARFLVRYAWGPLEAVGVNDPTSPAKNYEKQLKATNRMLAWSRKEHTMLIAGHTHKPVFPDVGGTLYFNDGSCVHPRCITAIEIIGGTISLVKWSIKAGYDGILFAGKEVLEGPIRLSDYFHNL